MIGRIKLMFVAIALGLLPLGALAFRSPPTAAAAPSQTSPGDLALTDCPAGLRACAPINGTLGQAAFTNATSDTLALEGSDKLVDHATSQPGQPLGYTIRISNAGASSIPNVVITDTLPAELTFANGTLTATDGSVGYASGVITWTGSVNAGGAVTIQFEAASLPGESLGTVITNTAVISGNGELISRSATTTLAPATIFLPFVSEPPAPPSGIHGHVTFKGAPASGVFLELRHFDGNSFSTTLSTNTDGKGFYDFASAPSLPAGQYYYVRYLNQSDSSRISFWGTAEIKAYAAGSSIAAGDFDLANVPLVAPNPGATVSLPAPFQWTARAATPTDSYQLSLFDPSGSAFGQTNPLGYVNGIILTSVPNTFHAGTPYGWFVAINSPDGGYGESYYYRQVTFTNISAGSQPAGAGGTVVTPATGPMDRPRR